MDKNDKIAVGAGIFLALTAIFVTTRPVEAAVIGFATVSGQVNDENNLPVAGVSVTLGSLNTQTGPSGVYLFEDVNPGSYDMSFSKTGYQTRYL
jgi:hypothetical protein